jgi:ATP diphosphatase
MSDDAPMTPSRDIARLLAIMAALRAPSTGCPWDLEQSFATIAPYTIEEAYEVADAIQRGDMVDLEEELGDLLLQVAYHAQLAEEVGAFDFGDVVHGITAKMIRRHPHVFGDAEARSAGVAKGFWENIKAEEKAEKARRRATSGGASDTPAAAPAYFPEPVASTPPPTGPAQASRSLLADVPVGLPALTRAVKLQDKAAGVGFDWPSLAPVFDKMREEMAELEAVAVAADPRGSSTDARSDATVADWAKIEEELGDLLFVMANVARHLAVDPEAALRGANDKFRRRFAHIEARLAADGRTPDQSDLAEMDRLWDEAKGRERGGLR